MAMSEERLVEKVGRLFNLDDFLYSFFFGLLPSLMDIATDFSFADRLRQNTWEKLILTMTLTRLAKEGNLTASGVAYAVIMLPGFELAIVQIFKITRTQESALLVYFLTTAGHISLSIS